MGLLTVQFDVRDDVVERGFDDPESRQKIWHGAV